jgi:hypothetical protein
VTLWRRFLYAGDISVEKTRKEKMISLAFLLRSEQERHRAVAQDCTIQMHKKSKQCLCVIETNNSPDNLFTEIDTCLDTYCLLVWILKQKPASTSDSRRDFIISNLQVYIRAAPLGQNRNISAQVQCRSKTKHASGHVIQKKSKQGVCVIETNNPPDNLFTEIDTCLDT